MAVYDIQEDDRKGLKNKKEQRSLYMEEKVLYTVMLTNSKFKVSRGVICITFLLPLLASFSGNTTQQFFR